MVSAREEDCLIAKASISDGAGDHLTFACSRRASNHCNIVGEQRRRGIALFSVERVYIGYNRFMMEFVGFDSRIPDFRIRQLQDSARPYLREPTGPEVLETWYGWRPMTWDSLPIIGRVPSLSNALLATGHNMLGLTLAAVTGKVVADIIGERPSDLPLDAISPARF